MYDDVKDSNSSNLHPGPGPQMWVGTVKNKKKGFQSPSSLQKHPFYSKKFDSQNLLVQPIKSSGSPARDRTATLKLIKSFKKENFRVNKNKTLCRLTCRRSFINTPLELFIVWVPRSDWTERHSQTVRWQIKLCWMTCVAVQLYFILFCSISHLLEAHGAVIWSVGVVSRTVAVACDGKPPAAHVLTKTNCIPTI